MFSDTEREEIRQAVYQELIAVEERVAHQAGSYTYLCLIAGSPCFCHTKAGPVLRTIGRA
jgi:hypothetical protein